MIRNPVFDAARSEGLVWYASYGSNLAYEKRFLCYIKGGTPTGSTKNNPGCRNSALPVGIRPITLNFELYFAGHFKSWGGAAAFIRRRKENTETLGRMYLITAEQFNDVILQENSLEVDGTWVLPTIAQIDATEYTVPRLKTYACLLLLGQQDGKPIVTFTKTEDNLLPIAAPSESYVKVIAAGLMDTYPHFQPTAVVEYLMRAEGIKGRIPCDQLTRWVAMDRN